MMNGVAGSKTTKGFDALIGNMPFLGGTRIRTHHGGDYASWLTETYGGTGHTDYVGYFFLRAGELIPDRGAVGLIATDAIADGDSRKMTLAPLLAGKRPMHIYHADTDMPWPGSAAVFIAVIHLGRGEVALHRRKRLNARAVNAINSRLRAGRERSDPEALPANAGFAMVGCFLRGEGFILSPEEAARLLEAHPNEVEVVRPFVVGNDLNSRPEQAPSRFVVSFEDRTLEEAQAFPAAFEVVDKRVRNHRERLKSTGADAVHKKYWWRFANTRRDLRHRLSELDRALATARVAKHVAFSFIAPDIVPSEQVVVFPLASYSPFAVLQSRVHTMWVRLLAGARGQGVRYSASECFASFPFPRRSPAEVVDELETAGAKLYEARARALLDQGIGLTELCNRLVKPSCQEDWVCALRKLHEELDEAVLRSYGWDDILVPPFCVSTAARSRPVEAFHDEVIDRLLELNTARVVPGEKEHEHPLPGVRKAEPRTPGVATAKLRAPEHDDKAGSSNG